VTFRDRLLRTLEAAPPVLDLPGAIVVGSEVPNLLQPGAASTLVVRWLEAMERVEEACR
jgi:hypothetical protein